MRELSGSTYTDTEVATSPVYQAFQTEKATGDYFNSDRAHHVDPLLAESGSRDFVIVDGNDGSEWSICVYTTANQPTPAARIEGLSSSLSVSSNSWTVIPFNQRQFDVGQAWDGTNDKYDVPATGVYRFGPKRPGRASRVTPFRAFIRLREENSATTIADTEKVVDGSNGYEISVETLQFLSEGESLNDSVWQSSGGSQSVDNNKTGMYFKIERVR